MATKKRSASTRKKAAAKKTPAKKAATKRSAKPTWPKLNVVPDSIDLRDRPYQPSVMLIPAEMLVPSIDIPVLNQKQTSACTGFGLASVIFHLQFKAKREKVPQPVSPFMLYSMARRYDEFPGDPTKDTGSSLRGAMKGWYKYGACAAKLWRSEPMPPPAANPEDDWWQDSVRRPLGAYYRVDPRSVTDMQVALNEIGVLYASAVCHAGWMDGLRPKPKRKAATESSKDYWVIPQKKPTAQDGAHAFAIIGYTREGFIIQNSWDTSWASNGRAVLTYQDWIENAMDCWVAQLGVTTDLHTEIARAPTLRVKQGRVQLASDQTLRNRELGPFIIDMEHNGRLSNTGDFRTQDSDVGALLNQHLGEARTKWGLRDSQAVDVAIYAHGGLTSEDDAANTAAQWIPAMYERQIFPIFLMWETDLWSTLKNIWADTMAKQPRTTGAVMDRVQGWWDARLERLLTVPGTRVWGEMKQNADAISGAQESGGFKLYEASKSSPYFKDPSKIRLHLIGHSAGAIVHSYIINRLRWNFETVNFMAPAVRTDLFQSNVVPAIRSGKVKQFNQFALTDDMEQKDPTCKPILDYGRSLLYLVSQSFEKGEVTSILGMEKFFTSEIASLGLKNVSAYKAVGPASKSTTHGGFDDDQTTRDKILSLIKG
jgi:hypothetical protein